VVVERLGERIAEARAADVEAMPESGQNGIGCWFRS
jgi:hypothetical protein